MQASELRELVTDFRRVAFESEYKELIDRLEAMIPQPVTSKDWPDSPGVHLLDGEEVYVTKVDRNGIWWTRTETSGHHYYRGRDCAPIGKWVGPLQTIIPETKEPSVWDYEPQEGDWVYVCGRYSTGDFPRHVLRDMKVDRLFVTPRSCLETVWLDRLIEDGYRFAKAEVSAPPEKGGA